MMIKDDFQNLPELKVGARVLIEVELNKSINPWENDSALLQSLFEEKSINDEFTVKQVFFENDSRTILLGYINRVRDHIDELERKLLP